MLITESVRGIKYIYHPSNQSIYLQIAFIYSSNPSINPPIYPSTIHQSIVHPCTHSSIYPYTHSSIFPFIHLSSIYHPSIRCPSIYPPIHPYPYTHSSILPFIHYPYTHSSAHPFIHIPTHSYTHSSIYPSIHPSIISTLHQFSSLFLLVLYIK